MSFPSIPGPGICPKHQEADQKESILEAGISLICSTVGVYQSPALFLLSSWENEVNGSELWSLCQPGRGESRGNIAFPYTVELPVGDLNSKPAKEGFVISNDSSI